MERSGASPEAIEQISWAASCLLGKAALGTGLPKSVEATTLNKMCGSGMQAAILAHDSLAAGTVDVMMAGGMESMTGAPYLLLKHRAGARIGHDTAYDYMFLDGLEDAYETDRAIGSFVEETARAYQFTREAMDEYAISSLTRARAAAKSGAFKKVIVPVVVVPGRGGAVTVSDDEQPLKAYSTKISTLKPAFAKDGAITAANAPSISDGAAALVITRQSVAKQLGMNVVARIVAHGAHAHEPGQFTTAPVPAIQKTLKRAGWSIEDVDLFEVNEPFACVAMIAKRDLRIRATSSTSTALPVPWVTPFVPVTRGSSQPCWPPWKLAAAGRGLPASALAAARRRPWWWNWFSFPRKRGWHLYRPSNPSRFTVNPPGRFTSPGFMVAGQGACQVESMVRSRVPFICGAEAFSVTALAWTT